MKHQTLLALYIGLAAASPLNAKWQRVPTLADKPLASGLKGLASNATITGSAGFGRANSLLSDDPTDHVDIAAGNSNAVINFGKPTMINRSAFANDGIEGRATLSGSSDQKGWAVLDEKVFTSSDRDITFAFAGMQVKFVKLEFALSKGGSIRNFQLFGGDKDKDYYVKQSKDGKDGYPVNFAGVGGSRVLYASPKPEGDVDQAMAYNTFACPESDERYRTLIYELGQVRIMNEFGSVHSPRPVRFEVFAFEKLPEKEDWRGRLAFNPTDFQQREPVAAAEDTRGLGYLKAKPKSTVKSRYLALRWEPDFNPPSFGVSAPAITGSGFAGGSPGSGQGGPGGQAASNPGHTGNGGASVGDAGNAGNGGGTGGGGQGNGGTQDGGTQDGGTQDGGTQDGGTQDGGGQVQSSGNPFVGSPSSSGVGLTNTPSSP
jgi:hypothetical protein